MLQNIELIAFEEKEPRAWVRKCVKYFEGWELQVFFFLLFDRADASVFGTGERFIRWEEFKEALCTNLGIKG